MSLYTIPGLILETICGPEHLRCTIDFTFATPHQGFVDSDLRIKLLYQLDTHLKGFLFFEKDVSRLKKAIILKSNLEKPVVDSDLLITIRADQTPDWVEWSLEWKGIYPTHPLFDPEAKSNATLQIGGLRVFPRTEVQAP